MHLNLRSLEPFLHAVDPRSLSKAAERSHIALAAASRRIALLEAGLGVGVLPRKAAETYAASLDLRLVALSDPWARFSRTYFGCQL